MALPADDERDPTSPVEDPHPLVDGPSEGYMAVHLAELVIGQPDGVAEVAPLADLAGSRRHRHLVLRCRFRS